jgi:hypothetical protein
MRQARQRNSSRPQLGLSSAVDWRGGAFASAFRLLAILLVATVQSGCWEGTTRETLATVLFIDGPAQISSDGGRTFSQLRPTETPGKGEILRTDSTSRVSLALLPNCLVHLDRDTAVEIVRINLVKDGNETGGDMRGRFARLRLINGRIFISHVWGEAPARLGIATADGEVSTPSNAAFWVEFAGAKTRVTCVSGWIEFQPSGAPGSTRIRPGSVGQWPSADGSMSAADADSRGQDDVQQAIELEQRMRSLMSQKRNLLPR